MGDFKLPYFFNYPPYFTLQPVRDTREKQVQVWKELILAYCKHHKIYIVGLEEDFPLFSNPAIDRKLSHEAKEVFLSALVSEGRAEWLDKGHKKCLILWRRIQDWAEFILQFVRENGLEDSVMTLEEIRSGVESRGTGVYSSMLFQESEDCFFSFKDFFFVIQLDCRHVLTTNFMDPELAGIDRIVLVRTLKLLEQRGKAVVFKGTSTDDEGVKFSALLD